MPQYDLNTKHEVERFKLRYFYNSHKRFVGAQKWKDWYGEFKNRKIESVCGTVIKKNVNSISESRNRKSFENTPLSHSIHRKVSNDMNGFCTHNRFAPLSVDNTDNIGVNTYCQDDANSTLSIDRHVNNADTREKQNGVIKRLKPNTKTGKLETTVRKVKSNVPTNEMNCIVTRKVSQTMQNSDSGRAPVKAGMPHELSGHTDPNETSVWVFSLVKI